jgi:hypothetical protein
MRIPVMLAAALLAGSLSAAAQFKSQVPGYGGSGPAPGSGESGLILGFFDPSRFTMRHSLNLSYQTFSGQGMSLGTYTNSMMYQVTDELTARADVSLSYSPYNSFTGFGKQDFSSIYLSRAEVSYRPSENFMVNIQYRAEPYGYYSPFGYGSGMWGDPWGR